MLYHYFLFLIRILFPHFLKKCLKLLSLFFEQSYQHLFFYCFSIYDEGIETEIIQVGNKGIRGCIACGRCKTIGQCVFNDDLVNEVATLSSFFGRPYSFFPRLMLFIKNAIFLPKVLIICNPSLSCLTYMVFAH